MTLERAKLLANDIMCAAETLRAVAEELNGLYAFDEGGEGNDGGAEDPPWDAPTRDDVAALIAAALNDGNKKAVGEIMKRYTNGGKPNLSNVDADDYPALMAELQSIGKEDE